MNAFYIWIPLVTLLAQVALAGVALRARARTSVNYTLALFLALMALWALFIFGFRSSLTAESALLWERLVLPIFPLIATAFFYFAAAFSGVHVRAWGGVVLAGGLVLAAIAPTPLVLEGVVRKSYGWAPDTSLFSVVWLLAVYVILLAAFPLIWRTYRRSATANIRNRSLYIMAGLGVSLSGAVTDYLAAQGLFPYPLGIIGNLLFALILAVAIVRYRLLEIQFYVRRSLAYFLALGVVVLSFVGLLVLTRRGLAWQGRFDEMLLVAVLALAAILLQPLVRLFQDLTDRWAFRSRYEGLNSLRLFAHDASTIIDLDRLATSLLDLLGRALDVKAVHLLVYERETDTLASLKSSDSGSAATQVFARGSPLLLILEAEEDVLEASMLKGNSLFQGVSEASRLGFEGLQGELFIPMRAEGRPVGLLVIGRRATGQPYNAEEINLLLTVCGHAALAMENARLYALELRQIEEMAKLDRAKSDFFLTAAHHLKTPLTTLRVAVDIFTERAQDKFAPEEQRLIAVARRAVDSLQDEIVSLLEFLRVRTHSVELKLEPAEAKGFIEESVSQVLPLADSKRQLVEVELEPNLPPVQVDREWVKKVLVNLLDNASRYTPAESHITVEARLTDQVVTVRVRDTGPGLPAEQMAGRFASYYQGRDRCPTRPGGGGGGSGLGLAISTSLIEMHGGRLWTEDTGGSGACLAFSLPIAKPVALANPDSQSPLPRPAPIEGPGVGVGDRLSPSRGLGSLRKT